MSHIMPIHFIKYTYPKSKKGFSDTIRNYFTDDRDFLISQDGVKFVVCNQWTLQSVQPIVQFANSLGYNVVEYK